MNSYTNPWDLSKGTLSWIENFPHSAGLGTQPIVSKKI